jgi:FkbM family methyltransferase
MHLRKDWVFLDVGAHAGAFSFVARKCKAIIAVEPDPVFYRQMTWNARFIVRKMIGVNTALGAETTHSLFFLSGASSSLHPSNSSPAIDIPVLTMDFLLRRLRCRGITRFDAIKIDVEGSEADVLLGGINALTDASLVIVETDRHTMDTVSGILLRLGFTVHFFAGHVFGFK